MHAPNTYHITLKAHSMGDLHQFAISKRDVDHYGRHPIKLYEIMIIIRPLFLEDNILSTYVYLSSIWSSLI